ncbi:MAG: ATP-binding protein [Clostridia bacterium]|nr:ATP-binding protein [Clostridia bacterium]
MDNSNIYLQCIEKKKNRLIKRESEYNIKLQNLQKENEEYADAVLKLKKIGSDIAISVISGNTAKVEKLKIDSVKYNAIKSEIEKNAGIKPFAFECDICKDTGFFEGKPCQCIKKMVSDILSSSASKFAPMENCRFGTFQLDYYEDSMPDGANPKKRMTKIFKELKEYTINFNPKSSKSLIFFGNTGLGKTHLSLSIMNELIEKGFFVHYDSAFNLFSKIETERFNEHTDTTYKDAVSCDLLIIDDLGSEFVSAYTQSVFYSIINTRILAAKPTIINTNLSLLDIENKYTPRVSSRIMGEYIAKQFIGNDIRQKKIVKKV